MKAVVALVLCCLASLQAASAAPRIVQGISGRVTSLDPFTVADVDVYDAIGNVIEPLARLHPKTHELIPCLAASWEIRRGIPSIRVRLREGVRFHNGEVLTAADVKFTFDAFFDPRFKGEAWRAMWEDIESATVLDPLTVEFRVKRIRYQSLENLMTALRIVPASAYRNSTADVRRRKLIGTGPFTLRLFVSGRRLELTPHRQWWSAKNLDFDLLIKPVADALLARTLLDRGELDFYRLPTAEAPRYLAYSRLRRVPAAQGEGIWLYLNLRKALFADVRLREALSLVWDRDALNAKVFAGEFRSAVDSFSPPISYYPAGEPDKLNLDKARKSLKDQGWRDGNRDGVLERASADDSLLPLRFSILFRSSQDERWLTLYQADAAKAGIKVDLQRVEDDSRWWKLLQEGKYDVAASTGGLDTGVLPGAFHTKGFYNITGYANAEVDRELDRLEGEFDPEVRMRIQRALILRVRADRVTIPGLYSPNSYLLVSPRLDLDPEFPTYTWKWRLKDRRNP